MAEGAGAQYRGRVGAGLSQLIARKVRAISQREKQELTGGTRAFIDAHTEPADQQVLPAVVFAVSHEEIGAATDHREGPPRPVGRPRTRFFAIRPLRGHGVAPAGGGCYGVASSKAPLAWFPISL